MARLNISALALNTRGSLSVLVSVSDSQGLPVTSSISITVRSLAGKLAGRPGPANGFLSGRVASNGTYGVEVSLDPQSSTKGLHILCVLVEHNVGTPRPDRGQTLTSVLIS